MMKSIRTAISLWLVMIVVILGLGALVKATALNSLSGSLINGFEEIFLFVLVDLLNMYWLRQPVYFESPLKLMDQLKPCWPLLVLLLIFIAPALKMYATASSVLLNLVIAVLVALFEEFLFRGLLFHLFLKAARAKGNQLIMAAVASSALFSLTHLANLTHQSLNVTVLQLIFTFVFGLLLCGVYYKSGSLIWPLVLHALNDFIGFSNLSLATAITPTVTAAQTIEILIFALIAVYVYHLATPKALLDRETNNHN